MRAVQVVSPNMSRCGIVGRSASTAFANRCVFDCSQQRISSLSNNKVYDCFQSPSKLHDSTRMVSPTIRFFSTLDDLPSPPTSNHKYSPLPNANCSVLYTETDEAPALATYSLYPLISKVSFGLWFVTMCKLN